MKVKKPRYAFEGHAARYQFDGKRSFDTMAELHQLLWPDVAVIRGSSRTAHQIFQALNRAYTAGIEAAARMDDDELRRIRLRIERSWTS